MERRNFAFDRVNFILLAAGMIVVVVGFILMSGPGSNEDFFNPDIFSVRRIKVAPAVCLFGFLFMIYGILRKPADKEMPAEEMSKSSSDIEK
ncbi:MAG: DUF3098 domain-containing protein [Paraprevotella sp.]|nr:DUF3098 domain-containing protein [Paraprevotella sp.]